MATLLTPNHPINPSILNVFVKNQMKNICQLAYDLKH